MKALKFKLSGRTAFFKCPEVNSDLYYTYGNIHKVALLGIIGAVMGYGGYMQMEQGDEHPEFYEKLKNLKIAIAPLPESKGVFPRKVQQFNNSVGYASKEQGGNLIVKQQWLENPVWYIYMLVDSTESEKVAETISHHNCKFIPYLGSNDHIADIDNVEIIQCDIVDDATDKVIGSLFHEESVVIDYDDEPDGGAFRYAEYLPVALTPKTNMYITDKCILTNCAVIKAQCDVYQAQDINIVFI